MIRSAALLVLCVASSACATDKAATAKTDAASGVSKSKNAAKPPQDDANAAQDRDARLSGELIAIDHLIDRFVTLAGEPGDDARNKRNSLGRALTGKVTEFKTELVAMAADASNPVRRCIAVKALGFCEREDDRAALPPLMAALSEKGDVRLLTCATYALGRLGSPHTEPGPLLEMVKDADPDVRSNALLALARVFDAKRAAGGSPLDAVTQRDVMLILEPASFDPADPLIRAHAAAAMGALGDKRGVDPIINLLRDDHPLVRTQAAIALSKIGDMKAAPELVKAIDAAQSSTSRQVVVLSLGALLEKHGHKPPEHLGDDARAWGRYVGETMESTPK